MISKLVPQPEVSPSASSLEDQVCIATNTQEIGSRSRNSRINKVEWLDESLMLTCSAALRSARHGHVRYSSPRHHKPA